MQLQESGPPGLLAELVETFEEDSRWRLADLREALMAGDGEALERTAHALKGRGCDRRREAAGSRGGAPYPARSPRRRGILTISVGLSELDPGHDKSAQNMLRGAGEALHEAKRRGKNRVMVNDACRI